MRQAGLMLVGLVAVLVLRNVVGAQEAGEPAPSPHVADAVQRFIEGDGRPLTSYRARRTLSASSRGGKMRARLVAMTTLDPARGFEWQLVEEEGSGVIRGKVLKAALEAEVQLARKGDAQRGALTPGNYQFAPDVLSPDGHLRVGIRALRSDTMLLNGHLLLTAAEGDLVRVEGQLVKRPSFWTRKVWVTREYGRVNGVRVPLRMTSHADVLMARMPGRITCASSKLARRIAPSVSAAAMQ